MTEPLVPHKYQTLVADQIRYYNENLPSTATNHQFPEIANYLDAQDLACYYAELSEAKDRLQVLRLAGNVLEIACGVGTWTEYVLSRCERLTAIDSSAERLRLCRERLGMNPRLRLILANVFDWEPSQRYDFAFFAFWISHVPSAILPSFLAKLDRCLEPGGAAYFIDHNGGAVSDTYVTDEVVLRVSPSGKSYVIPKIPYTGYSLPRRFAELGWRATVEYSGKFFLLGSLRLANMPDEHAYSEGL